jgi:hypothetical protein
MEGFDTDELVAHLDNSPTKKLIMELNHAYGLKVINVGKGETYTREPDEFYMGYEGNGLAFCNVWTEKDLGGGIKYNFRTPFYCKERGGSTSDKETLFSCKLSSLMATIKKQRVVLSPAELQAHLYNELDHSRYIYLESFGDTSKRIHDVDVDDIHVLLSRLLDGKDVEGVALDLNKCKIALDKYNKANTIRLESNKECERIYEQPFYFIGSTGIDGNDLLIGVLKRKVGMDRVNYRGGKHFGQCQEYEVIKPLKRFKDFDDAEHGHIKALLTMLKVATESIPNIKYKNMIPINPRDGSLVDKNLDTVTFHCRTSSQTFYNINAVITPCGEA